MSDDPSALSASAVRVLADLVALPLPEDRLAKLAATLSDVLAGQDALAGLDLSEVEPELGFDARWE